MGNDESSLELTPEIEKNDMQVEEGEDILSDALSIMSNMSQEPKSTSQCETRKGIFHRL